MTAALFVSAPQITRGPGGDGGQRGGTAYPDSAAYTPLPFRLHQAGDIFNAANPAWTATYGYTTDVGGGGIVYSNVTNNTLTWNLGRFAPALYRGTYLWRQQSNGGRLRVQILQNSDSSVLDAHNWECYAASSVTFRNATAFTVTQDSELTFSCWVDGTKDAASTGFYALFVGLRINA